MNMLVAEKAKKICYLLLDVDGILTNGTVFVSEGGEESLGFSIYDGMGIALFQKAGLDVGFVSGRKSMAVAKRAVTLGVSDCYLGIAVIIISREFIVTGLRMSASLQGVVISAESFGKYKMFFQSTAIVFLLLVVDRDTYAYHVGFAFLLLSMVFSMFSACQYFFKFGERLYLVKAK